MRTAVRSVHVVVPADVGDPRVPSGGNTYDLRVCRGLADEGWAVDQVPVAGRWPRPDAAARAGLAAALAALPAGAVVLLDGLVVCGVPDVVVPQADRLRLVVLVHMPLADAGTPDAGELDAAERLTLHAASAVVATSRFAANRLIDHHGVAEDRVHVVAPGTDPAPVAPGSPDGTRLLSVAAVTPGKGQDTLVRALASVADLPWRCTLVGSLDRDPEFAAEVGKLIDRVGLAARVELAGPSVGAALGDRYAAADLVVLASRTETFGMVVIESLARGVPVLATAVGALPDTLGRTGSGAVPGLLVPADDDEALGAALRRWLAEPELRQRARSAALQRRGSVAGWAATARAMAGVLAGVGAT
ncbi:MAG TPA: glycosyltransferase [Pseudonocardiaceae bacterium]|nr:glycosyltransferase [Pseudonocardiaceae bacterium]